MELNQTSSVKRAPSPAAGPLTGRIAAAISLLLSCGCLSAADNAGGPLGRPVIGYVAQADPLQLRAIFGVPGSAVFSDPLVLPRGAARLHLAPGQAYALVDRWAGDPVVFPLGTSEAQPITLTGVLHNADFVAFSPKAQSVLLYSMAQARLQIINGLPNAPSITSDMDTSAFVEQPLDAAVSDDAGSVLLTSAGAVYQLQQQLPHQLISVNGAAALTFLPGVRQAAIADRGAGLVYLWQPNQSAVQLAGGLTGVGELRPAGDGQGLWLTNPAANTVSWLGVKTAQLRTFNIPVSPSQLDGLPYRDMFLIASDPGEPAWFLFQQGSEAVAAFVPAVKAAKAAIPAGEVRQ